MTIDGVNIWTYGFGLSEVKGLYTHPARKKTIRQVSNQAKDIVLKDNQVTVILIGLFEDYTALKTGVDTLIERIRVERTYSFSDYSKLIRGFVTGGAKVEIEILKVKITFKIIG